MIKRLKALFFDRRFLKFRLCTMSHGYVINFIFAVLVVNLGLAWQPVLWLMFSIEGWVFVALTLSRFRPYVGGKK
jgi:xanthine/uracil/vitamin C permease (AzgA family)